MAIIQTSSIVSSIKGSVGGTTYSMNRAGLTAKKRATGKRVNTQAQSEVLSFANEITKTWNGLDFDYKLSWNSFASANTYTDRFGNTKILTGFQFFKMINWNKYYITGTYQLQPPSWVIPNQPPYCTLQLFPTTIELTGLQTIDPNYTEAYIYLSNVSKATSVKRSGILRQMDIRGVDLSTALNLTTMWEDYYGLNYSTVRASGKFVLSFSVMLVSKVSYLNSVVFNGIGQFH